MGVIWCKHQTQPEGWSPRSCLWEWEMGTDVNVGLWGNVTIG